jgi:threonine synthase
VPMIALETALPAKFEDAIVEALGHKPDRPVDLIGLEDLPQRFEVMEADAAAVKQFISERTS